MPTGVTTAEYIRWVKASLNRVLGTDLVDNADDTAEYRYWIKEFQINQHLVADGRVNSPTQDALMMRSRDSKGFAEWVQRCLNRAGVTSGMLPVSGFWNDDTTHMVKIFQGNEYTRSGEALAVDGWVGAKTEWALYRAGKLPIPGRYKLPRPPGAKPKPSPSGWSDSLTPELRANVWFNGMHIDITTNPSIVPDADQRRQMLCFLDKLRKSSGIDYAYLGRNEVHNFVMTNKLEGGADADDISTDAKHEILLHTRSTVQRKDTYSEGWSAFQIYVWQVFYAITRGQNRLAQFVSDFEGLAHDAGVRHLKWWVNIRQDRSSSILSCFK